MGFNLGFKGLKASDTSYYSIYFPSHIFSYIFAITIQG